MQLGQHFDVFKTNNLLIIRRVLSIETNFLCLSVDNCLEVSEIHTHTCTHTYFLNNTIETTGQIK